MKYTSKFEDLFQWTLQTSHFTVKLFVVGSYKIDASFKSCLFLAGSLK